MAGLTPEELQDFELAADWQGWFTDRTAKIEALQWVSEHKAIWQEQQREADEVIINALRGELFRKNEMIGRYTKNG